MNNLFEEFWFTRTRVQVLLFFYFMLLQRMVNY